MAEHLFSTGRWTGRLRYKQEEVWKYIFLYGTPFDSVRDKDHIPLIDGLRDLFERHIRAMDTDPHDQSSLIGFLTSDAGQQLLPEALIWLAKSWEQANSYFWSDAAEDGRFETFLNALWKKCFPVIRANAEMLKAFKVLTLNLAARQVPIALEIQRQIGSG